MHLPILSRQPSLNQLQQEPAHAYQITMTPRPHYLFLSPGAEPYIVEATSTLRNKPANKSPIYAPKLVGCNHNCYTSHNFQILTAPIAATAGLRTLQGIPCKLSKANAAPQPP